MLVEAQHGDPEKEPTFSCFMKPSFGTLELSLTEMYLDFCQEHLIYALRWCFNSCTKESVRPVLWVFVIHARVNQSS